MRLPRVGFSVALALGLTSATGVTAAEPARAVKVTVLSTMLAGNRGGGVGEWGFAALLEVDGQRLLIDTGERPETVLRNASELGIDLSDVSDVVLTHNHSESHSWPSQSATRTRQEKSASSIPGSRRKGHFLLSTGYGWSGGERFAADQGAVRGIGRRLH